jgi:hypothetical protein
LPVWFNAWRYEREKNLAVIPFLRQINIALEKDLKNNRKTEKWNTVKKGLELTFAAFVDSTTLSTAVPGSPISATVNLRTIFNTLRSKGSIWTNSEQVPLHEHATDFLENALHQLRSKRPDSRIVVFIDDLDRCTPERALEVLESIKSFFDIEGIVYVIGMDPNSIDSIIKQKYGDNLNVIGLDYMQKIVQLPFQIPFWNESDIERYLNNITNKRLGSTPVQSDILDNLPILTKAIKWNPREAKRFINNVLLARAVFDKPIDELIVVQALNFRSEWKKFLELIMPDDKRKEFLHEYKKQKKQNKTLVVEDLESFNKELSEQYPSFRRILEAYPSFFNQNDNLRSFLDSGADKILLEINDMEGHRRALKAVSTEGVAGGWGRTLVRRIFTS